MWEYSELSERIPVRRPSRSRLARWAVVPIIAGVALILAGCTQAQLQGFEPGTTTATNHTEGIKDVWVNAWIVLLSVGLVTWGLMLWAAIAYRRRKGQTGLPVQLRYNMPIEIFFTVVPFILVVGFFAFTAREEAKIQQPWAKGDKVTTITVYAKRWAWDFEYDTDGVYSQNVQAQLDSSGNIIDSSLPTLYLPVGQKIQIDLKSRDVIHDFWVVDFLYKEDVIPARTNYEYFIPEEIGTYQGKCAELCGEYHSLMLFTVKVVSVDDYNAQMQKLRDAGNVGTIGTYLNTNSNAPGNGDSTQSTEGRQ